ncbi:UPF0251 protein [Alkalidesulfovibrio alkalitolerans DSM 16529]|uniref:UPF0251 protein dsat_2368 n=1 Tax=Alkalidesulfovibrio alkalitolerans DSM 16529 TaxID=1121439 RepID=S7TEI8_9BACT|nr:DUF134 domain-containing protein [Alkalidesulfovibrio alkalitolerans]EPR35005.1 UPF0251 protein [Alkalidesulfovibrio alkalitolerans DSM 16529]
MGRHRKCRRIEGRYDVSFFKPRGIPMSELTGVSVPVDGIEAMRLVDAEGLSQEEAAGRMGVSAPTLCRILAAARSTVARALAGGMAIRIDDPRKETGSEDAGPCQTAMAAFAGDIPNGPGGTSVDGETPASESSEAARPNPGGSGRGCRGAGGGRGKRGCGKGFGHGRK